MKNIEIPEQLIRECSNRFHVDDQLNQMLEEAGELIVACNHYRRGRIDIKDFVEEMCDTIITISQSLDALSVENGVDYEPLFRQEFERKIAKLRSKLT